MSRNLPDGYELTFDQSRVDVDAAHAYLSRSYWAENIPLETVRKALSNSLCVTVWKDGAQVALARVITDRATFAYLADVYVLEEHRGKGLSKVMVAALHDHPELQGLRRWALFTADAQELYRQLGWTAPSHPDRAMERHFPNIYKGGA